MSVLPEALMGISTVQLSDNTSIIMGGMAMDTCPRDTVREQIFDFLITILYFLINFF